MKTLFIKFFLAFWLCLLLAAGLTGAVLYALRDDPELRELAEGPRAQFMLESAQAILEGKGPDKLQALLSKHPHKPGVPVYAVSETGQELLDRELNQELQQRVQQALQGQQPLAPGVLLAVAPDQTRWVLFMPRPARPLAGPEGPGGGPRKKPPPPPPLVWVNWVVVLVASTLFAGVLAYWFSRPLSRLRKAFQAAATGDLSARLSPPGKPSRPGDELGQLLAGYDHMATELQARIQQQKTLLHDVSHELRSPLARLNLATGLARQNPEQLEYNLDRIEREAERLDQLIDELLRLSRLDSGSNHEPDTTHDVMELLAQVVDDAQFEAEPRGVNVELTTAVKHWLMRCDAELLMRSFDNIVRNALKHSEHGQVVMVSAQEANGQLCITVADQGPGVPQGLLSQIFDPFFKHGDKAGQGLGLAIAKRGIEQHHGQVKVELVQPHGLQFAITLAKPTH
ncbi:MAG: ATP-binding protein [Limnobacter sp.]|uniref:HAMP domain-containing sensor histidine kinase n=1 Tax=Limnobacter sp. TaxID=2003368 RepID=UPI00391D2CEA